MHNAASNNNIARGHVAADTLKETQMSAVGVGVGGAYGVNQNVKEATITFACEASCSRNTLNEGCKVKDLDQYLIELLAGHKLF